MKRLIPVLLLLACSFSPVYGVGLNVEGLKISVIDWW